MSKVERLIAEWEMEPVGQQLENHWLGTGQEQYSLRQLADWFNERLLERALEDSDESYVEGEIANMYDLLTSDDASPGDRSEVETRLERAGIDIDDLRRSFVSHQSIYTYLTKVRGVSQPDETTDESQIEKTNTSIQQLVNRTNAVVDRNLANLRSTGRISLGEFSVFVDVNVYCHDCESQYRVPDLLTQRGCDCNETEE